MKQVNLVVIGAGPHSLSLSLRLVCSHPFDENTFDAQGNIRTFSSPINEAKSCNHIATEDIMVLDPSGKWMNTWNANFNTLEISHLRSSVLVHVDAYDSLSLLEFISKNGCQKSLPNVFDNLKRCSHASCKTKRSKRKAIKTPAFNEAQRKFFSLPSAKNFSDHTEWLINNHNLDGIVESEFVTKVTYHKGSNYPLQVSLASGETVEAKAVVYAGNHASNRIPQWAENYYYSDAYKESLYHSSNSESLRRMIDTKKSLRVLLVGGGLSSGHLAVAAQARGHKVTIVSRSHLKVKQFDIPPSWMSTKRNLNFCKFYELSNEERYKMIYGQRDGGSITPQMYKKLQTLQKSDKLNILVNTLVQSIEHSVDGWKVIFEGSRSINRYDVIVLGTGKEYLVEQNNILGPFLKENPISVLHGLPLLEPTLKWNDEIPLYVMGAYAGLEIGPDALNLIGGRVAASRIANDIFDEIYPVEESSSSCDCLKDFHVGNRFQTLMADAF